MYFWENFDDLKCWSVFTNTKANGFPRGGSFVVKVSDLCEFLEWVKNKIFYLELKICDMVFWSTLVDFFLLHQEIQVFTREKS